MNRHRLRLAHVAIALLAGCGGPGGGTSRSGTVSLAQNTVFATTQHTMVGFFTDVSLDALRRGELPGCTLVGESGDCRALTCTSAAGTSGVSAGTLTASVDGTMVLSAMPAGTSSGYNASGTGMAFTAGQTVSFNATGGLVPAFAGSVTAPEAPVATLPSTIARGSDLVLTWNATVMAESVQVAVVPAAPSGPQTLISCRTSAGSGSLTVSSTLLGDLATGSGIVSLSAFNETVVTAGEHSISVTAAQGTGSTVTIM
jgi:hypothetical protein